MTEDQPRSHSKNGIPDRWLDYESVGKQIGNTPFVAFKVPLKNIFTKEIPPEKKFGPTELMEKLPNLSLVIDLTNTQKYYNSNDFHGSGIEYKKIFCPGHEIPRKDLIKKFFTIVDEFIKKKADSEETYLIGVHCTHGINRTGFFICCYLINKLGYNSENAISEFNSARGHSIERINYLKVLKSYDLRPLGFQTKTKSVRKNPHFDSKRNPQKSKNNSKNESFANQRPRYVCPFDSPRFERGYRNNLQSSEFFRPAPYPNSEEFHHDYPVEQNWRYGNHSSPYNQQNFNAAGNSQFETSGHFRYQNHYRNSKQFKRGSYKKS